MSAFPYPPVFEVLGSDRTRNGMPKNESKKYSCVSFVFWVFFENLAILYAASIGVSFVEYAGSIPDGNSLTVL